MTPAKLSFIWGTTKFEKKIRFSPGNTCVTICCGLLAVRATQQTTLVRSNATLELVFRKVEELCGRRSDELFNFWARMDFWDRTGLLIALV